MRAEAACALGLQRRGLFVVPEAGLCHMHVQWLHIHKVCRGTCFWRWYTYAWAEAANA